MEPILLIRLFLIADGLNMLRSDYSGCTTPFVVLSCFSFSIISSNFVSISFTAGKDILIAEFRVLAWAYSFPTNSI